MTMWANQNQYRTKTEEIVEMCLIVLSVLS